MRKNLLAQPERLLCVSRQIPHVSVHKTPARCPAKINKVLSFFYPRLGIQEDKGSMVAVQTKGKGVYETRRNGLACDQGSETLVRGRKAGQDKFQQAPM